MAAAGLLIVILASPVHAISMLLSSAGPALVLGCGFLRSWKAERILICTVFAAFAGLFASSAYNLFIMGLGIQEVFSVQPETIEEIVAMFVQYGLLDNQAVTVEELTEMFATMFSLLVYMLPGILFVGAITIATINYKAAYLVFGKLRIQLPKIMKLSTFRLPITVVFFFILGVGMLLFGWTFWRDTQGILVVGQNVVLAGTALYFFQGLGMILYYIGKAPVHMHRTIKFGLLIAVLMTNVYFLLIVGLIGVVDALCDFRKLEFIPERQRIMRQ